MVPYSWIRSSAAGLALIALSWLTTAGALASDLLVYEPFAYPAGVLGGNPPNGLNLSGPYAGTPSGLEQFWLRADGPGLTYGALSGAPSSIGNKLNQTLGIVGAEVTIGLVEPVMIAPGQAIYWSALFTFDDSSNGNRRASIALLDDSTGDQLAFGEPAVGVRDIRVSAATVATGELIASGADNAFADGQTLLLIGRYVNSADAGQDTLELIGYDTAASHLLPPFFDPLDPNAQFYYALTPTDIDFGRITSIQFAIRGDGNNFIDELRIGSSYAAVVPEPSTYVLLAMGLIGLLAARKR